MDSNLICGDVKNNHVNSIKYHVAVLLIYLFICKCGNRCSNLNETKKKGLDEDEDFGL